MSYDKTYKNIQNVFGSDPEIILKKYSYKIDKTRLILDIGIGQGRNSFYLAEEGFQVEGIDPSGVAIEEVNKISKEKNFKINTYHTGFNEFEPENAPYSAILIFGLIQILEWDSIYKLIDKINLWTEKGSMIFITAFSTKDASYLSYSKKWKEAGKNSFTDGRGNYRTFLAPNEITGFFKEYNLIYHWEGLGPKHRHGNSPVEQHMMIELVVEKK